MTVSISIFVPISSDLLKYQSYNYRLKFVYLQNTNDFIAVLDDMAIVRISFIDKRLQFIVWVMVMLTFDETMCKIT
jgi:hypothetical protein